MDDIELTCNKKDCFWNSLPHKIEGNCGCTDVLLDFNIKRPTICRAYSPKKAGDKKAFHLMYQISDCQERIKELV
jgi:hypothetical protein